MLSVIVMVLLVHLVVIQWAKDSIELIQLLDKDEDMVTLDLQAATPAPISKPAVSDNNPPKPAAPAKTATLPAESVPTSSPATTEASTPSVTGDATAKPAAEAIANAGNALSTAAIATPPAGSASESQPESQPESKPESKPETKPETKPEAEANATQTGNASSALLFEQLSFPPSAELSYDAVATQGNRRLSGSGSILWQQNGQSYTIKGEASAFLLALLSYQSTGQIDSSGIAPTLYYEKRLGKSPTNTHFVRERKTISFSASTASFDLKGGEQDRGSVIWQLAGMARGNPSKLEPGLAFDAIVAGSKAADRWHVLVIGRESLALGGSTLSSWHLSLTPAENNFDYQIELWFSPERDWYPAKIVYGNRSGASLTMTLAKLKTK